MFAYRTPGVWLAPLRIAVGAAWSIAAYQKIVDPTYDSAVLSPTLQHWATTAPEPFATFVVTSLIPHLSTIAFLLKAADALVGIALIFGFLTPLGASIGFVIAAGVWIFNDGYANLGGYASAEFITVVTMLFLMLVPAGLVLGVDRALFGARVRRPRDIVVPPPTVGGATT